MRMALIHLQRRNENLSEKTIKKKIVYIYIYIYILNQNKPRFRFRLCVLVKLKIIDHMATLEYKIDKRKKSITMK